MMKNPAVKNLIFLLVLLAALTIFAVACAENVATVGQCGDNVSWVLNSSGDLTITGTGPMHDYNKDDDSNPWWEELSVKTITIDNGVTTIGNWAFSWCENVTTVTIPGSVTSIGNCAFNECSGLKNITVPDSVTSMGFDAFCGCSSLTSLPIGKGMTDISVSAFSGCNSLKDITIPDHVTSIDDHAFEGCSGLTSIVIPKSVTDLGLGIFYDCPNLKKATIKGNVANIYFGSLFSGCPSLTEVIISSDNPYYSSDGRALYNKDKSELLFCPDGISGSFTIPGSVTRIKNDAFGDCRRLTDIMIPDSVINIEGYTFYGCTGLTGISIPTGITRIEAETFADCSNLSSVTLPAGIGFIDSKAFKGCAKLKDVYYGGTADDRANISIGSSNDPLINATWHYQSGQYTVTVTTDGNGTASANPASGRSGTVVTLAATANEGYRFGAWQVVSGGVTVENNQFTIGTADVEIKALFEKIEESSPNPQPDPSQPQPDPQSDPAPQEPEELVTLKKIKISKLSSPSKKKVKVEWKKLSSKVRKKAKMIEVQISTDKAFTEILKTKALKSSKTSYTFSGLKKNTKYYVRIRVYTEDGNVKYVSPWSSVKKIKTKKK